MRRDFEKAKDALWTKWERKMGMTLPPDFRAHMEEVILGHDEDGDLKDLDDEMQGFFDNLKRLHYFPSRKKTGDSAPGKRYQRCFDKRLYLVEFVLDRHLAITEDQHKKPDLRKRINWKQICTEWNAAHSYDRMSPAVLKVRYYRALAEKDIIREYWDKRGWGWNGGGVISRIGSNYIFTITMGNEYLGTNHIPFTITNSNVGLFPEFMKDI